MGERHSRCRQKEKEESVIALLTITLTLFSKVHFEKNQVGETVIQLVAGFSYR
jgi:hypothetical protein